MIQSRTILACLGRFGDAVSVLPLGRHLADQGERPIFCIAKEFASVLEGVSYVDPLVYPGLYNDPPAALRWLRQHRKRDKIILAQSYRHPTDKRQLTGSYQTESWRVAGYLSEFGKHQLVFDRRDSVRESLLLGYDRPMILVATGSVSSPFAAGKTLLDRIQADFKGYTVVDLSTVKAERIYDLLALYEAADLLVSVDTVHLHLARAAKVPVVAITNRDWFGSVPPPATICHLRYADFDTEAGIDTVSKAISVHSEKKFGVRRAVHVIDDYSPTDPQDVKRYARARKTWQKGYGLVKVSQLFLSDHGTTSADIADDRNLPLLRDVLAEALAKTTSENDVIVFSNTDNGFTPSAFERFVERAIIYGAFSIRRSADHIGRDVFGFSASWLRRHLDALPSFYLGAPAFDLVLAALIRKERGIVSTARNLMDDFYPCEIPPGLVTHEDHQSGWAGEMEHRWPANLVNQTLARQWCGANGMEVFA